jgi:hypothetical protein
MDIKLYMPIVNMLQYWILFLNIQAKASLTLVPKTKNVK